MCVFSAYLNVTTMPWLVWLSRLSAGLQTKSLLVQFLLSVRDWVAGLVPGTYERQLVDVSLKKINK